MTEIGALPGPSSTPAGNNQPSAIPAPAILVETPTPTVVKAQSSGVPALSQGSGTGNAGWGQSALAAIYQNVGVDYGRIAALMMLIDSELARAARDERVMQIDMVAEQMHAIADDIRTSANLALAGGVVSGAAQIGAGAISVGGGIKGMAITRVPSSATSPASPVPDPATPSTPAPATPTTPNTNVPSAPAAPASTGSTPAQAAPTETAITGDASTNTTPAAAQQAPQADNAPATADGSQAQPGQPAATDDAQPELSPDERQEAHTFLDHTVSQHLSAKAQNIALLTQGLSQLSTATGDIIKNVLEFEARQMDAHVKDTEAELEERRAYLERIKGFSDTMQKGAHDLLQIFQQVEEGIHQTSRHIWSRA